MIELPTAVTLDTAAVQDLATRVRGTLIRPDDASYEDVRRITLL
jgi:hypothetical protein